MNVHEQDIPTPPRLPWVGNLLSLPRDKLTQHLLRISRDFDGILALDFAGYRVPFVYDPDLVGELSDPQRFGKVIGPPLSTLRKLAADGLFTARSDEPNWGKAHRILMPAFGQRAMKGYFPVMLEVAEQLCAKWAGLGPDADLPVADDMTRLTLDTISLAGFGYRFDSFKNDQLHPFLDAMVAVLDEVMTRLTRLPIQNRWMSAGLHKMERDIASMHALVDEVIRARRAQSDRAGQRDLLDLMLQARDPISDERLDDENIRAQVITFLIAGHETTSGLLTFALYQLMRHPETLAQCYAEVDEVMPPDQAPAFGQIGRLAVIDRVLRETLRLWPTAPSYSVAPHEDVLLGGRWRLRAGQRVNVLLPALHRNPRFWERPEAFDIDRWLPQARERIHPYAYRPFGNGERACIGQQFALTEAKLALAMILRRFALSDAHDYHLEVRETLTLKPDGFRLRASPRRLERSTQGSSVRSSSPLPEGTAPQASAAPSSTADLLEGEQLQVLFGSSVGTCADIAEQVAAIGREAGLAVALGGLDAGLEALPERGLLVVVTATYNGRAPDNARRLEALLDAGGNLGQRPHLRFAVLGCGNSQWPAYQAFPKRVAQALESAGAKPWLPRAEADGHGDFDRQIDHWLDQLRSLLPSAQTANAGLTVARSGVANTADLRITLLEPEQSIDEPPFLPAGAESLELLASTELVTPAPAGLWDFTQEAPRASTRWLRLRLPEAWRYKTGDHLAVWPENDPQTVDRLMARLGLDPACALRIEGEAPIAAALPLRRSITVHRLLSAWVEWQDPARRRDIERLHAKTRCPVTRTRLARWLGEGPHDDIARDRLREEVQAQRLSVVDLLMRFPAIECEIEDFLLCCTPMRPRWYSISSSALAHPHEASLTVGSLEGPHRSGTGRYRGLASTHLCSLGPGARVLGKLRTPVPDFAPPADPRQPMILIGPGTGIAPFRGFIQERAWQRAQGQAVGPIWLITGARHPQHDALHAKELAAWQADGLVQLHEAFSSLAGHPWRFVQDVLWAQREPLERWLQEGAALYLCGDGKAMAPAVRDCLVRIRQEAHQEEPAAASAWLESLSASGRFRQDVFN